MNHTARSSLQAVLRARRQQFGFRLANAAFTAGCFGTTLGWRLTGIWFGLYALLQLVENACFNDRRPVFPALGRSGYGLALTLLFLNSVIFGAISLPEVAQMGGWGAACAACLLIGAQVSIATTTIGCRIALYATITPMAIYFGIGPIVGLLSREHPSGAVTIGLALGSMAVVASNLRLWRDWTHARRAQAEAVERQLAERLANEKHLSRLAHLDAVTSIPNRIVLREHLARMTEAGGPGALLLLDLDGFKYVNDTLGHPAGDRVLCDVAVRLQQTARPGDLVARLGGDEFAVLLPDIVDPAQALRVAERIVAAITEALTLGEQSIRIGASIGVALNGVHGQDADELFANADIALYRAKADGRHCARLFQPELRAEAMARMSRDEEFRAAFERREFELFFQPQFRPGDGRLIGAEALLRWRHPALGLLSPGAFLSALDGSPLAAIVGQWVIEQACRQAAAWHAAGLTGLTVAVNLFGVQCRSGTLVETVRQALDASGLPGSALELEITENIVLHHGSDLRQTLVQLRALGVGVAFDDYGTGYASLSLLKTYPLTRLKIDRTFVQAICDSPADESIVRAIVNMARAFGVDVIAEGVETTEQATMIGQIGCPEVQGFLFGAPVSAADFERAFVPALPATATSVPAVGTARTPVALDAA